MKILFIDPVCWKEHVTYNQFWIETLNTSPVAYDTAFVRGYYKLLENKAEGTRNYEIKAKTGNDGIINNVRFLWSLYFKIDINAYKYIIFSSINKLAFLCSPFFWGPKAIIVSHTWKTPITNAYRIFLKIIGSRHFLISLDKYIYQYLLHYKINTYVISHPISQSFDTKKSLETNNNNIHIFAPSKSIDRNLLETLYKDDTLEDWLKTHGIKLHIRNQAYNKKGTNIVFSTGYIPDSEYKKKFRDANIILIAYPKTFTNRVSNVFYEAIGNQKKVLLLQGTHLDNYLKEYDPNQTVIKAFTDVNNLKQAITLLDRNNRCLTQLITEHSLANMQKQFNILINS